MFDLGVRCKEGEFPDEWLEWLNENLLRGVDPGKLVSILASKGFHPHRNITLMHRILTWCSLDRFLVQYPDLDLTDTSVKLHEDFLEWLKETAKRGIDGEVIWMIDVLTSNRTICTLHRSWKTTNSVLSWIKTARYLKFWTFGTLASAVFTKTW